MKQAAINYASVLYELSIEPEAIREAAGFFAAEPRLYDSLCSPLISQTEKFRVIDRIFQGKLSVFLKLVCRYGRAELLPAVFEAYEAYREKQLGMIRALVYTTEPLTDETRQEIEQQLKTVLGSREILLEERKDDSLLGGYKVCAGGMEFDYSWRGRLEQLDKKLTGR